MIPLTDAMTKDADAWFDTYSRLSTLEKVAFIRDTLDFPLTDEFLADTEFATMVIELKHQAGPVAIAPLIEKIRETVPAFHHQEMQYLENDMVIQGLFLQDLKKAAIAAAYFREDPERVVDYYLTTFRCMVLYGAHDIARAQAEAGLIPLRASETLIGEAEADLAQFLLLDYAQSCYIGRSLGRPLNAEAFVNEFRRLWPTATDAEANVLYRNLDSPTIPAPNSAWRRDIPGHASMRASLFWSFLIEMYETRQVTFAVAASIWSLVWRFLEEREGPADNVCFPTEVELDQYLSRLTSLLSMDSDNAFTLIWGIPYVANFLRAHGWMTDEEHAHLTSLATAFHPKLMQAIPWDLWQYDYVHRWAPPEGTDLAEWDNEKRQFQDSFTAARPDRPSSLSLTAENLKFDFGLGPMDHFGQSPSHRQGDPKRKSREKKNRKKSRQKRR